jgi:hypothetical protein
MKIPKPIFLLLAGVLIFANCKAQVADTISQHHFKPDKQALALEYQEKAKSFRSIGIPLTVAGTIAWIVGVQGSLKYYDLFTGEGSGYIVCLGLGIGATITGTILMIRSGYYQSKARFLLDTENISRVSKLPIKGNLVSLGFVIPLK